MMISTKGRYALRIMIDLAEHNPEEYIRLKDIANRQNISEKYLETIIKALSQANFVQGLRGKGGGYRLTREASTYTIGSILKLTEGSLAPVACLDCSPNQCSRSKECKTLPMWEKLDKIIDDYFESITLSDLLNTSLEGNDFVI
ncbi:MAG: Rrf2 family transcriptional regulator [Coprobacillus sp.]